MILHKPLHPGLIVKDALIDGANLTVTEAAEKLDVTRTTLSRLLNCHAGISPGMALRLSKLFGTSIEMWINIQAQYDIWTVMQRESEFHVKKLNVDKVA